MVEIARALGSAQTAKAADSVDRAPSATSAPMTGMPEADGPAGRILVLDEPTSALSLREADALLAVLARLKGQGLGILYVSHKLEEVFAAADRISVLRNGRSMGTLPRADAAPGRDRFPDGGPRPGRSLSAVAPGAPLPIPLRP